MASEGVLTLGIDVSGINQGAIKATISLDDLKKAAAAAATAIDATSKAGNANGGPAAQGAQAATRSLADLKAKAAETGQELFRVRDATGLVGAAFDRLRNLAVALGVAWGGMKLAGFVDEAARSAARFETLGVVMNRVAQQTPQSAYAISEVSVGIEKMGITMQQSRQSVIQMVQAQIDLTAGTKLARLAQDAAVVGNINSSEAMSRLIYGIQSGQVEVLRTIGLNVNFEQSYQQLAITLHKPVEALSELEKSQARTNAALKAGVQIAGAYESAMDTAGKQLLSMQRYIDDATVKIGNGLLPAFTSLIAQATDGLKGVNKALDSDLGQSRIAAVGGFLKEITDRAGDLILAVSGGLGVVAFAGLAKFAVGLQTVRAAAAAIGAGFLNPWVLGFAAVGAGITYMLTASNETERAYARIAQSLKQVEESTKGVRSATDALTDAEKTQAKWRAEAHLRKKQDDVWEASEAANVAAANLRSMVVGRGNGGLNDTQNKQLNMGYGAGQILGPAGDSASLRMIQLQKAVSDHQETFSRGPIVPAQELSALTTMINRVNELSAKAGKGETGFAKMADDARLAAQKIIDARIAVVGLTAELAALHAKLGAPGTPFYDIQQANQSINQLIKPMGMTLIGDRIGSEAINRQETTIPALQDRLASMKAAAADEDAATQSLVMRGAAQNEVAESANRYLAIMQTVKALLKAMPELYRAIAVESESLTDKATRELKHQIVIAGVADPVRKAGLAAGFAFDERLKNPVERERMAKQAGLSHAADLDANPGVLARLRENEVNLTSLKVRTERGTQQGEQTTAATIQEHYAQAIASARGDGAEAERRVTADMERQLALSSVNGNLAATEAKAREASAKAMGDLVAQTKQLNREAAEGAALGMAQFRGPGAVAEAERAKERARLARVYPTDANAQAGGLLAFDAKQTSDAVGQAGQRGASFREQDFMAKKELSVIGAPDMVKQRVMANAQIEYQRAEAMSKAVTDEQKASVTAAFVELQKYSNQLMDTKEAISVYTEAQQAMKEAAGAISTAFEQAVMGGQRLGTVMQSLGRTIEQIALKMLITKPLENMMSGAMNWATGSMGAAAGGAGGAAGGAGMFGLLGTGFSALTKMFGFANGGTFPGASYAGMPGISDFSGSIVSSPTMFRFANGGALGQMGEAGAEAIMPLQRDARGRLGVSMSGGGSGGAQIVVQAPVTIQGGGGGGGGAPMDARASQALQKHIEGLVQVAVRGTMASERRPGGDFY